LRRVTSRRRPAGAGLLRLYPGAWRERYEAEVLALLEQARLGRRARLDLVRGALDARLHTPSRAPAVAALLSGAMWTIAGVAIVGQPAPPDWPGYLIDVLPLTIVAVVAGLVAIIGCWARRSDGGGRLGAVGALIALAGHVGWALALVATLLQGGSSLLIVACQAVALTGCVLVGLLLVRSEDLPIGAAILLASAIMFFGWPAAWLGFGLAWTIVGVLLLARPEPSAPPSPGFA
jgi:hypothetical protein